ARHAGVLSVLDGGFAALCVSLAARGALPAAESDARLVHSPREGVPAQVDTHSHRGGAVHDRGGDRAGEAGARRSAGRHAHEAVREASLRAVLERMHSACDPKAKKYLASYFGREPGELKGLTAVAARKVAYELVPLPLREVEKLLASNVPEVRYVALEVLVRQ